MDSKNLGTDPRWAVLAFALCLFISTTTADAGQIEDKLSAWGEQPSADRLRHERDVRSVAAYLLQMGSLVSVAGVERLLAEEPYLLEQALEHSSVVSDPLDPVPPPSAMMTVVGLGAPHPTISIEQAGVYAHDGAGREAFLNWNYSIFGQTAAVVGRQPLASEFAIGGLGVSALGIDAGVFGSTSYSGGTSYGVYAETNKPEAIAIHALHEGVETDSAGQALYVSGNHRTPQSEAPGEHAALIENRASEWPSVLALRMSGEIASELSPADNFVTFFVRNNANTEDFAVGAIEGNGSGGVQLNTLGGDIAEYLERLDPEETIGAGDVVGVVGGKVTKVTDAAQRVMVISSGAAVAGNSPGQDKSSMHSLVAFVGQVPTRVRGPVSAGDFIVASGAGDGCGRAVHPERMTAGDYRMLVGRAWETSPGQELRLIKTTVGMGLNEAFATMQGQFEARLAEKDTLLARLEARMETLSRIVAGLDRRMAGETGRMIGSSQ